MLFQKRILAISAILAIGALPVLAAQTRTPAPGSTSKAASSSKPAAAPKIKVAEGSIVQSTDDMLTLRQGKKDMNFKISSTTEKPTSMTPGSTVKVSYHDEGTQHIASSIQLAPTKSNATAAKPPARK
jgi:hypothetical protein